MGRWVTSQGRRIYIPDEGEKVPEKYKKNVVEGMKDTKSKDFNTKEKQDKERVAINIDDRLSPGIGNKWTDAEREKDVRNFLKEVDKNPEAWKDHKETVNRAREYIKKKDQISKDADTKEKQIAANKAQKDKLNGKEPSLEEKKQYLRDNNLTKFAKELNPNGNNTEGAINYVYDQHTLSKEEFRKKYFGDNKKQVDKSNGKKEEFVVGNNPPTTKEQAYMNYKAIKISKNMPKEKQEELKRLKAKYRKEWKGR